MNKNLQIQIKITDKNILDSKLYKQNKKRLQTDFRKLLI